MLPIVIIAAVVLLAAGTSAAASRPTRGEGGEPLRGTIKDRYGYMLDAIGGPMPKGVMLKSIKFETGGRPLTVVADKVTGGSEVGLTAVYVEHDRNANPDPRGEGAATENVDPLNPWGSLYASQRLYQKALPQLRSDLTAAGFFVPSDSNVPAWIMVLYAKHSIGRAAFKKILELAAAKGIADVEQAYRHFAYTEMPPKIGRQDGPKIRKRLRDMLNLPAQANLLDPLPARLGDDPVRVPQVPPFDGPRVKRFILAERERVRRGLARRPDGSPPGVA